MPKLKAFLSHIAKKAGVDPAADNFKTFFEGLPDVDVPDDLNTNIDNSLLSITDAKNNHQDIRNHYTAQALSSVDSTIKNLMDETGLDDAAKAEINAERSSFKKIELITKKIADLESKKHNNKGTATQQEIDRLQEQLRIEKANIVSLKQQHEAEQLQNKILAKRRALIAKGQFPTKFDDLEDEVRYLAIEPILENELASQGAKWALDQNGNLTILKNDGSTFYSDNHQAVVPKSFVESTLTRNKIIAPLQTPPIGAGGKPTPPAGANGQPGKNNSNAQPSVAAYNKSKRESMEESMKSQGWSI